MIRLKQKLFLLQFFLFSILILLFIINNNKVIAMYPDNTPGTSNKSLTEDHVAIDKQILKVKDILATSKKIIIVIKEFIKNLPDENIKKNMFYELQESLTQLIDFAINHNSVTVTNIDDSGTSNLFSTQYLIIDPIILNIKNFIETHKNIIINLEKIMQALPNGKNKKYLLCELYNFLIQSFDDNKKELQIQEIVLELMS
ncbi:MAG: SVM family protein [Pigeon pea little leaf phytoplasma]|uniref:SVM family protein n=1 Tax=Candidatus Phytoplasma fabacearum TaxID=2982628 RepID=A0ABU8ZSQ5_9MOLU|nr:SVM family protein ['Bituminaria bituminosa' little leaf phytoplasma]MDV3148830.1 SVM family protein [Pigeon pea little leaf phytoplasma]MDO7983799.1 SVM family protein ['Bituminaria bituminosa' little leaf phytoplasma]MDO8024112.1 SVM family protein ['Bituminaria bituminosa' little leaf phytoplasma]MDO8030746.1 SVM family protein ['Bituminaria bituminosa' little leaf phytoplasma]MDV3154272.1 SVM family protein [Pigeon pea little leaf phytoplasma]